MTLPARKPNSPLYQPSQVSNSQGPTTVQLKRGQTLFAEGESSRAMYLIKTGSIRVFKKKGEGAIEIDTVRAGQVIGELAFLDGNPRSASAEALTETTLVEISGPTFEKTLTTLPDWIKILIKTIVARLRAAGTRIRQLENTTTAIEYNPKDGKGTTQFVFVSPIEVMKIASSLLLVGSRQKLEVRLNLLTRYANQIMGVPASKITSVLELFAKAGILAIEESVDDSKTILQDIDFLEQFIAYMNEENLAEPEKRRDITPKGFLVMGLIVKNLSQVAPDKSGITQVNLAEINIQENEVNGKDAFRIEDLEELVKLHYIGAPNVKSQKEIFAEVHVAAFIKSYRFQRLIMSIRALNDSKRKMTGRAA